MNRAVLTCDAQFRGCAQGAPHRRRLPSIPHLAAKPTRVQSPVCHLDAVDSQVAIAQHLQLVVGVPHSEGCLQGLAVGQQPLNCVVSKAAQAALERDAPAPP